MTTPTAALSPQAMAEEIEALELQCDVMAIRLALIETANDESVSGSVVDRMSRGEPPLKVWREYRGYSLPQLAEKAGVAEDVVRSVEDEGADVTLRVAAALARALDVDAEDLIPWPQEDEARRE
jgi:DNA-binding XRE family transcriptional regulator